MIISNSGSILKVWDDETYLRRTLDLRLEYVSSGGIIPLKVRTDTIFGDTSNIPKSHLSEINLMLYEAEYKSRYYTDYDYIRRTLQVCKICPMSGEKLTLMYDGTQNKVFLSPVNAYFCIEKNSLVAEDVKYLRFVSKVYEILNELPSLKKMLFEDLYSEDGFILIKEWLGIPREVRSVRAMLYLEGGRLKLEYDRCRKKAVIRQRDGKIISVSRRDIPKKYLRYIQKYLDSWYMWG